MLFLSQQVELSDIDQHIYKYICANYDKVIYMRIRELAKASNVSTSTVLRFCKKFGCEGYAEFKYKLRDYLNQSYTVPFDSIDYDQSENIAFLEKLDSHIFEQSLDEAAHVIADADLIIFVGVGASGTVAQYGVHLFSTLVSFSLLIDDPQNMPMHLLSPKLNHDRLCFIVLSVSGEQEPITHLLEDHSLSHKKVISITNGSNSTLAKASDINFAYYVPMEIYDDMNVTSQIPAMAVLEALSRRAFHIKNTQGQENP